MNKDSHSSNKAPSSDAPCKKPPPRSQSNGGGRKPGGQKSHLGASAAWTSVTARFFMSPRLVGNHEDISAIAKTCSLS